MKYTVYYQILTKKMKSIIEADSELQAKIKPKESLQIIKVETEPDAAVENLKKMFGMT